MLVTYDFTKVGDVKPLFSKSFDLDLENDCKAFSTFRNILDSIIESLECLTGSKVLVRTTEVSWYKNYSEDV